MKKLITSFILAFLLLSNVIFAEQIDTSNWYVYNVPNSFHPYSIYYPNTWKVHDVTSDSHGLSPKNYNQDLPALQILEFQGITEKDIIKLLETEQSPLLEKSNQLLSTQSADLFSTTLKFQLPEQAERTIYLINRGITFLAIQVNDNEFLDEADTILNSLKFNDSWHQYFDFKDSYTFIFPKSNELVSLPNLVIISQKSTANFEVKSHNEQSIEDVEKKFPNIDLKSAKATSLNGYSGKSYQFKKDENSSLVILQNDNRFYSLKYNNTYQFAEEILSSFRFFSIETAENYYSFLYFPDVNYKHPNSTAINSLFKNSVIQGYPDGTFGPDNQINRAELTKMIVASKINPREDLYKDCFPDVGEEWFAKYICYAKDQGWVEGYPDGTFKPDQPVSRVEALKIILEAFLPTTSITESGDFEWTDVKSNQWYSPYFSYASKNKLLDLAHIEEDKESRYFFPAQAISRKEVAETIYRTLELLK